MPDVTPASRRPSPRELLAGLSSRVLQTYRRKDGLTSYVYDENRVKDERHMREAIEEVIAPAIEAAEQQIEKRVADLELALDLALAWLGEQEPGDSRAVSNEFVAMASLRHESGRPEECRTIIQSALAALTKEPDHGQ